MPILIAYLATRYCALVLLPGIPIDTQDVHVLILRVPTYETVLMSEIQSPNRDIWAYLEWYYGLSVYTVFGESNTLLVSYLLQDELEDMDAWESIIVDSTGCLIMEYAHIY